MNQPDPFRALFTSVAQVVARLYPDGVPHLVKIRLTDGRTIQLPIPLEAVAAARSDAVPGPS